MFSSGRIKSIWMLRVAILLEQVEEVRVWGAEQLFNKVYGYLQFSAKNQIEMDKKLRKLLKLIKDEGGLGEFM